MQRRVRLPRADDPDIAAAFADLRESLDVELGFPDDVRADAEKSVDSPRLPDNDQTSIPFVTIDPPESMDLDQALHLERDDTGFRVRYAIADVAAFVEPGGPMDREAHERGQTLYAPDEDARLYPPELSEGAGSLLPGETRPAVLWTMDLDETGEGIEVDVRRALVRSREKLDYEGVQRSLDDGTASESLQLLREVGLLRQEREARQGGVQLAIPEQEVEETANGYELQFRAMLPVEGWNAQISLMTGQAAAELMLKAELGVLRTLPKASRRAVERLRLTAKALGSRVEAGADLRGRDPGPRPGGARARRLPRRVDGPAPRLRLCRVRRRGAVSARACRRRRARTRTRPRRCAGSSTATSARSASPSARATRCPSGRRRRCPHCRRRWRSRTSGRSNTRPGSSRPSRRPC